MSAKSGTPEEPEDPRQVATGMTLADVSIRNHVFAWMLMAGLIGFGLICFRGVGGVVRGLGISQNPDVDFPVINVSLTYEGASPEVMETDVVDLVEDAITSVEGVKQITSTSRQGSASVTIEFAVLAGYGGLAGRLSQVATRLRFATVTNRIAGVMLMTAGAGLATLRRS